MFICTCLICDRSKFAHSIWQYFLQMLFWLCEILCPGISFLQIHLWEIFFVSRERIINHTYGRRRPVNCTNAFTILSHIRVSSPSSFLWVLWERTMPVCTTHPLMWEGTLYVKRPGLQLLVLVKLGNMDNLFHRCLNSGPTLFRVCRWSEVIDL
jgi:hypothetical protein